MYSHMQAKHNCLRENLVSGGVYRLLTLNTRKKVKKRNQGGICAT
jgi:hypothetical protein